METLFLIVGFLIFFGMLGYPVSILILGKIFKYKENMKDYNFVPNVTLLIVAHNEEKVIEKKMENLKLLDYPRNKLEIIVSSDNSNDKTDEIVKKFIENNRDFNIQLYQVEQRKGKTNAQNEAARIASGEIIVMTDANAILDSMSIREIVSSFSSEDIAYVTGQLIYINDEDWTSNTEKIYWNMDIRIRDIESRIQTITAGNGALYACRRENYIEFNPIECHDSAMPIFYALEGKRAISNLEAKAFEKAGESVQDEFSRKVRMARRLLSRVLPSIKILNFIKYKWFTYFYLGHRTFRYLLSPLHILFLILNILLLREGILYQFLFTLQISFYLLALTKEIFRINCKIFNLPYYYCLTLLAQMIGVINQVLGKSKPFWEKAESTR